MTKQSAEAKKIAVLLPARNEAACIQQVVESFRKELPTADIYVYDNASTDDTATLAADAGAIVRHEPLPGKGYVIRRMFADVEADLYIIADADGTNPAYEAPKLLKHLQDKHLDMVIGTRLAHRDNEQFRPGHILGNRMISVLVSFFFNRKFEDVMSGYRVMTRRFVKSTPGWARRFEVEPMLNIHAVEVGAAVAEVETDYLKRVVGTESKMNTLYDGARVIAVIFYLVKQARPFLFFGLLMLAFVIAGIACGIPVFREYAATGIVTRLPLAVLATGLMLLGGISVVCGLVLDSLSHARRELKRTMFISIGGMNPCLQTYQQKSDQEEAKRR